jgi:hypothetical protein
VPEGVSCFSVVLQEFPLLLKMNFNFRINQDRNARCDGDHRLW